MAKLAKGHIAMPTYSSIDYTAITNPLPVRLLT
jgi:hypothetical protein